MSLQKKQEIDEEDVTKRNLQLFEFSLELAPNWWTIGQETLVTWTDDNEKKEEDKGTLFHLKQKEGKKKKKWKTRTDTRWWWVSEWWNLQS